jgi:adenine phosphoribosyltransferase
MPIKSLIRTIPDYPKAGIMFRDITTLLADPRGFRTTVNEIVNRYTGQAIDKVAGIEARGFILGAPVAHQLGVGFVPVRKQGKLPGDTLEHHYDLEYGTDTIEIHTDAIADGERVLLVDDLIATGGTAEAAVHLIEKSGGEVIECCFIIDLPDVGGRRRLENAGKTVFALCEFEGD